MCLCSASRNGGMRESLERERERKGDGESCKNHGGRFCFVSLVFMKL